MSTGRHFLEALKGAGVNECRPLADILGIKLGNTKTNLISEEQKLKLWEQLSYLGSNNLAYALRGFEGIDYPELVRDACEKIGVQDYLESERSDSVLKNERLLVNHLFQDIWEHLSEKDREELLKNLGIKGNVSDATVGGTLAAIVLGRMGGFVTYQIAVIVANAIARSILGSGLAFATNAAIAEGLGVFLGPIGWGATGLYIVKRIADPDFKKTISSVVLVHALREAQSQRVKIGILGQGSVGKDSLIEAVFGFETKNVSPIPGSTSEVEAYTMPTDSRVTILNFPGFGDLRKSVDDRIMDQINNCTHVIYLMNGAEIPQAEHIEKFNVVCNSIKDTSRIKLLLNKIDKADDDEVEIILKETKKRVSEKYAPLGTVFKPGKDRQKFEASVFEVKKWVDKVCESSDIAPVFGVSRLALIKKHAL